MGVYDIAGFLTGVICVWLIVRENIWNWPWGIVNSAIFCVSFFVVGLYADSALQIVYVGLGFYGWWAWLHAGPNHQTLPMRRISPMLAIAVLAFLAIATYAFATVLATKLGSTVPFWDALTTALSLAAQFLLTRKIIDNWYLWIAADLIYIPLYVYKHLPLTAALYVVFLGLCIAGIVRWETSIRTSRVAAS
jgi:nicotinamide mononucleotide transporter